jgi:ribulose 1,5-bisphosphate synthetase/thiazole synthase
MCVILSYFLLPVVVNISNQICLNLANRLINTVEYDVEIQTAGSSGFHIHQVIFFTDIKTFLTF